MLEGGGGGGLWYGIFIKKYPGINFLEICPPILTCGLQYIKEHSFVITCHHKSRELSELKWRLLCRDGAHLLHVKTQLKIRKWMVVSSFIHCLLMNRA